MYTYILRRLLLMIPTLLGITIVVFTVMAASPGGISAQSLVDGQNLEPEAKQALEDYYNKRYGLDQPAPVQYLRWLNNVSPIGFLQDETGAFTSFSLTKGSDLGDSFRYGRSVMELIKERVPITALLNVVSLPIIYLIAIVVGVYAAQQRGQSFDVTSSAVMLALWSVPTMLAGILLIGFFASDQYWHWFPTSGLSDRAALGMPFMPHWSEMQDILLVLLLSVAGCALGVAAARLQSEAIRSWLFLMIGAVLGILWVESIGSPVGFFGYILLVLVVLLLFWSTGKSSFQPMRVMVMGSVGIGAGIALANFWMVGHFTEGFLFDRLWHLILPIICLSYGGFAFLAKLTRTSVLENLRADYARTALAKGVAHDHVLWRHVFRNSLLPLITVSASLLPGLLAGSVIVESIFSIDGMGKLAVEAVKGRDRELVLSITLISGLLSLIGYLIADLCYAIADPRVSYD